MGRGSAVQSFFRERLRAEREQLGWSQAEMAKALASSGFTLHASAIAKIESGDRAVRIDEAVAIADALDLDIEDMIPIQGNEQARLRRSRQLADHMMHETRSSAAAMVQAYLDIIDLLEEHPGLFAQLRDAELDFSPTTIDEYLSWVLDRMRRIFRLPGDGDRVVVEDSHRIDQLEALIEAALAGVVSDVPFADDDADEHLEDYADELVSRLRHPAVAAAVAKRLQSEGEQGNPDDAPDA